MNKVIKGFEKYFVTDNGEIWNKKRKLKLQKHKDGYLKINLRSNNKTYFKLVHRLVAIAFIPNPENKPQINHKNGIKTDNRIENLEWCDNDYNCWHKVNILNKVGNKNIIGSNNPKSIKILQFDKNTEEFIKEWDCIKDAIDNGFANSMIWRALKDFTKSCGGYKWKYK